MNEYRFEQSHMGTRITIKIFSAKEEKDISEQVKKAFYVFQSLENEFSIYRTNSKINKINREAGKTTKATPLMLSTVNYAIELAKETNGLFNPLVGSLTMPDGRKKTIRADHFIEIRIDESHQTITLPPDTALDLNSIVKGMAIDMALACLEEENVIIEAGGDIRVKGFPLNAKAWKIGIRNPKEPAKIFTILELATGAICTSGEYFRKEKAEAENRFHLVNPQNHTADNPTGSMTVIAQTAQEADTLSTAAFFMPVEKAIQFVENQHGCSCLIVDRNNEVYMGPNMKSHFTFASP